MDTTLHVFKALSDDTRLRIVNLLLQREFCVCEIQDILRMSEPRISRHLKILKDAGLIECRKEGKWYFYKILHSNNNRELFNYLKQCYMGELIYGDDIEKSKTINLVCSP